MVFISSALVSLKPIVCVQGWSKTFSSPLLGRIKAIGIRRRQKKKRGAGSPWQNQSATQCPCDSSSHYCCISGCIFLRVCMCVPVSLHACVHVCVYVFVCVFACVCLCVCRCVCVSLCVLCMWFGLCSICPRWAFQSPLQFRTEKGS